MSFKYLLTILIFFLAGFFVSSKLNNKNKVLPLASESTANRNYSLPVQTDIWPTVSDNPIQKDNNWDNNSTKPDLKFSIEEIVKIDSDKKNAETGEDVRFSVTLKNSGNKKKLLTHICFNSSNGITSGCILNKNLEANEQININNTMRFSSSGNYSVFITWSQDRTNFYRPNNAGNASVFIN